MGVVNYEVEDAVATVTLNRPESLNSMTDEFMAGISDAFAQVDADESVRVVVLTGAGRGFCSGADLSGVADPGDSDSTGASDSTGDSNSTGSMDDVFNPAIRAVTNCPVPTVGRINGVAAGGGFGLAMACDISIAARSAFFVATFGPRLGIVPDMGATWHLTMRAGPARARAISMLGGRITADEAVDMGLIWKAVDDSDLDAEIDEVTELFKHTSPDAMTRIRSAIADAETNSLSQQLDLEMRHQAVLIPANMVEGAAAFMEKREPSFSPARQAR